MNLKQMAGETAAGFVESGMIVGLGTGSTAYFATRKISERIRTEGLKIQAIPTSRSSDILAKELDIPLLSPGEIEHVDITIDGADEIDHKFRMIKGGGGALLREKIVASITKREIIVIDPGKLVEILGKEFALPVEVTQFGWEITRKWIENLGCSTRLRIHDRKTFITDNSNFILDCKFQGMDDPEKLDTDLNNIPGVVENGLFINLAHVLVIGREEGAEIRKK